jgi:hypothetical protein
MGAQAGRRARQACRDTRPPRPSGRKSAWARLPDRQTEPSVALLTHQLKPTKIKPREGGVGAVPTVP